MCCSELLEFGKGMVINMSNIMIKAKLLCKSFVSDGEVNNVIKNMDLEIYEGDFTVIMGSSGSGKSTLLYLLSGMDEVSSGVVELEGKDITALGEKRLADVRKEKLGFVFQAINLVPDLNIYENVASPTYKTGKSRLQISQRVDELLESMELTSHQKKFPNQLSGGQKQRVALCRALVNEPDIVFADEPTGALNSAQGENVLDTFSSIHEIGRAHV